jgi:hypothetical protein
MILQFLLIHVHGGTSPHFVPLLPQLHPSKWGSHLLQSGQHATHCGGVMLTLAAWACLPLPLPLPLSRHCLGSVTIHGTRHLLFSAWFTRWDPWWRWVTVKFCSSLGLVLHSIPPLEALELRASITMPLLAPLYPQEDSYYRFGWKVRHACCRYTNYLLGSSQCVGGTARWCCCRCQLWHPKTSLQDWHCPQWDPRSASIKHEPVDRSISKTSL